MMIFNIRGLHSQYAAIVQDTEQQRIAAATAGDAILDVSRLVEAALAGQQDG